MDKKTNFIDIIIYVVIAVILLTVLPILTNMSTDRTSSEPISSEPISSDPISSDPISSDPISSDPISSEPIPSYPTNVVVFKSDSPRTIKPKFSRSGITLQYSIDNGSTWNNISSGDTTASSEEIWFRGRATDVKSLYTSLDPTSNPWVFSGDESNKLHVYGDLRYLLCDNLGDNTIIFNIADYCFNNMFRGCISLITAPSLPSTTIAYYCYYSMFRDCTSLITLPCLPATTLKQSCYENMFYGCTALKVSSTKTGSYQYAWRIPTSETGTIATDWNLDMIKNTGGTYTDNPSINTTYYLENQPV